MLSFDGPLYCTVLYSLPRWTPVLCKYNLMCHAARHGHEVLPQDSTHITQRPSYQRESPCQDPAGNGTTRRPPDHCRKLQWYGHISRSWSGQNHLTRHGERGKKTRHTEEEVVRQHQGMDRPGVRQVPDGSREQGKWRKLVAKSSTTRAVKE